MKPVKSDYLVLGSGIAGLSFSLKAASYGSVSIITKKKDSASNTNYAQGGIATPLSAEDSPELHKQDTLKAGAELCNEKAVDILVKDANHAVLNLAEYGVNFTRKNSGSGKKEYDLGREGGHSINRIVHSADLTGKEIERTLIKKVRENKNITVYEDHTAIDLITEHQLKKHFRPGNVSCYGVYALDEKQHRVRAFVSKVTLLATGGVGQVFLHTTNPKIATGDGTAMAYRAGAVVSNLEFMQFHPTTLYHTGEEEAFLISEAVRGYGAELRAFNGTPFMKKEHPMGSLAPRDIVARAIDKQIKQTGKPYVFLDVTHKPPRTTKKKFPNIYKNCLKAGIDITKEMIPVVPAAHYMCGGVQVDTKGRTTIGNLFACGEVSCTGVHGANRLASNSLLEAVVFAERAFNASKPLIEKQKKYISSVPEWDDSDTVDVEEWILLSHNRNEIRQLMWDYVGIVRTNHSLRRALRRTHLIAKEVEDFYRRTRVSTQLVELRNMATIANLIVLSALRRKESRGLHYNTNFPKLNNRYWKRDTTLRRT